MVCTLTQLHEHVEHSRPVAAHGIKDVDVLGEDVGVVEVLRGLGLRLRLRLRLRLE